VDELERLRAEYQEDRYRVSPRLRRAAREGCGWRRERERA
jgi:hypothetical protein